LGITRQRRCTDIASRRQRRFLLLLLLLLPLSVPVP